MGKKEKFAGFGALGLTALVANAIQNKYFPGAPAAVDYTIKTIGAIGVTPSLYLAIELPLKVGYHGLKTAFEKGSRLVRLMQITYLPNLRKLNISNNYEINRKKI